MCARIFSVCTCASAAILVIHPPKRAFIKSALFHWILSSATFFGCTRYFRQTVLLFPPEKNPAPEIRQEGIDPLLPAGMQRADVDAGSSPVAKITTTHMPFRWAAKMPDARPAR